MKKHTGFLIALEGGEGGGKTTQVSELKKKLEEMGREVLSVREPGGTVISEQIREVVLSSKNKGITDVTEVLLFQAARAQIYREIVIPALNAGKVIIMDRTRDSSVVYQGIVRGFGRELIEQLNDISTKNILPNITLLLDVPVSVGLSRRADSGNMNRLDKESADFHQKVRDAYLLLAKENQGKRWTVINGEQSVDAVAHDIWKTVKKALQKKS